MIRIDFSSLDNLVIPGLNIQKGIKRLGNNPQLYFDLLFKFFKTYRDSPGILTGLESAEYTDELASFVHTLKGDAGNIEADTLYKMLQTFESGLKGSSSGCLDSPEISDLKRELSELIESLETIDFADFSESGCSSVEPVELKDRNELKEILIRLSGFLERHQPVESLELLDRLICSPLSPDVLVALKRSRELTDSYNFEAALILVNELAEASGDPG
ncbi:MAG: Hpt domain-containing protein [Spirochaetales bacterium]|nr:Hpt domain-containing protein [Spirochaetales bacterium]